MIELFLALLVIPAAAIAIWEHFVSRLSRHAWSIHRVTGLIGAPVHELSHVLVCLLFRLKIRKIVLYSPDAIAGTLGYVNFRYNPTSIYQVLGTAMQGIAPLLAGGTIAILTLGAGGEMLIPNQGIWQLLLWIFSSVGNAILGWFDLAVNGIGGAIAAVLLLCVCMHAIPSWADIRCGLKGLALVATMVGLLAVGLEMLPFEQLALPSRAYEYLDQASGWVESGMWICLYGAVTVVTLAILGSLVLILVPSGVLYCRAFWRGARGDI
ncbi:TPA: hypothetical protein ACRMWJ_005769 [Pseudomonas aeruginosa]